MGAAGMMEILAPTGYDATITDTVLNSLQPTGVCKNTGFTTKKYARV